MRTNDFTAPSWPQFAADFYEETLDVCKRSSAKLTLDVKLGRTDKNNRFVFQCLSMLDSGDSGSIHSDSYESLLKEARLGH